MILTRSFLSVAVARNLGALVDQAEVKIQFLLLESNSRLRVNSIKSFFKLQIFEAHIHGVKNLYYVTTF